MKVSVICNKCKHENQVGFKNFKEADISSVDGKAFAFRCKSCGEVLKFKVSIDGQNKG
jgi:uncharacterized Zn finger protein